MNTTTSPLSPAQKAAATRRANRAAAATIPAIPADISSVFVAAPKARPEDLEALRLAAIGRHRYMRNPNRREALCVCGQGQAFAGHLR